VVAPAIAGLLIAFVSVEGAYYVTAVLYAVTVLAILRVPPTSAHVGRTATAVRADSARACGTCSATGRSVR